VPREELEKNRLRIRVFDAIVKARLGETTLNIRDLLNLKNGDVITLNKRLHEDIDIYVEDELKFTGRAGLLGKYKAVEVLARMVTAGLEEESYEE
jgi:flagellar motor switch protein FliM